jgi:hypothetical protein
MHPKNSPHQKYGAAWNPLSIDKELGDLLRQIKKEAIPDRLLDLAEQLQAALFIQYHDRED